MKISDLQFGVAYEFPLSPQVVTGKFTAGIVSHTTNDVVLDCGITIKTTNGEIDAAVAPIVAAYSIQPKEVRMKMPEVLTKLLSSRRVWLAFMALIVTVVGVIYPNFPPSIVEAAQRFAYVLIGVITLDDTVQTLKG